MPRTASKYVAMPDPKTIFPMVVGLLADVNFAWLSEASGVTDATLYNWYEGRVTHPRIDTLTKVTKALGYEIVLNRRTGRPALRVV